MKRTRRTTIITVLAIAVVSIVLLSIRHLNTYNMVRRHDGHLRVVNRGVIWPAHVGGTDALYYDDTIICKTIYCLEPNLYIKSPDDSTVLYIEKRGLRKRYVMFCMYKREYISFPWISWPNSLVDLNDEVTWRSNIVTLSDKNDIVVLDMSSTNVIRTMLRTANGFNGKRRQ